MSAERRESKAAKPVARPAVEPAIEPAISNSRIDALHADLVDQDFVDRIPYDFARRHLIVSQGVLPNENSPRIIAAREGTSPAVLHNVMVHLGEAIHIEVHSEEDIARVLDEAYSQGRSANGTTDNGLEGGAGGHSAVGLSGDDLNELLERADRDLLSSDGKGPVVKLLDLLLFDALSRGASDLHVQPLDDRALVRYRVDGMLVTAREIPRKVTPALVSRIKVMGRMDIAESRVPQDGRATVTLGERAVDLRISTLPTSYGERAVLRILDQKRGLSTFDEIGMPDDVARRFLECASRAHGMVLLTGPTGSGKTTTLYSTLRRIGAATKNLMTIEDPIEYELSTVGLTISQAQVNPKKGVTFATGLRHILRQDPDVIMVGEIRDAETARIAIQSSLTGHLVFSTLHTNDAPSAVTRLVDLGVEPYLVSSSLTAVCAQRLVRLLHQQCDGKGCPTCFSTGFSGRAGLFELLLVDNSIRALIVAGAPLEQIRAAASKSNMRSLHDAGMLLVEQGKTTVEEVARVVQGADS